MPKQEKDINEKVDEVLKNYKTKEKIDNFAFKKALSIAFIGIILISIFSLYQTGWIKDIDGDGIFDNNDIFPFDPNESIDSDGDGIGDNEDEFPNNPTQYIDSDSDGFGDNSFGINPDKFPDNPSEWSDSDDDGIGDNADIYDSGNAGIRVSITKYEGDELSQSGLKNIAPYFTIKYWYSNKMGDDFVFDDSENSTIFYDELDIIDPFSITFDVAENIYSVKIEIETKNYNSLDTKQFIDINGESELEYSIIDYFYPKTSVNPQWNTVDGNIDNLDEYDGIIHYKIEIIGL